MDRNYPGGCCDPCGPFNGSRDITLVLSGIAICPCAGATGLGVLLVGSVNGTFVFPAGSGFTLTIPNAITITNYTHPLTCTGTATTTMGDLEITIGCNSSTGAATIVSVCPQAGLTFFGGTGIASGPVPNANLICGDSEIFGSVGGTGGTGTLS